MSARVHIIGVGSPFGDDRLGWAAAEALRSSPLLASAAARIEISALDRPGTMLLAHWCGADRVILIDAVRTGAVPGTLHRWKAADLPARRLPALSHEVGVISALTLARALGELPAQLSLHGVEIDPGNNSADLSRAVAQALSSLVRAVSEEALAFIHAGKPAA